MKKGIIKINPRRFHPVIVFETGRIIDKFRNGWRVKKDVAETNSYEICKDQIELAFNHLGEEFDFVEDHEKGYAVARIFKKKK